MVHFYFRITYLSLIFIFTFCLQYCSGFCNGKPSGVSVKQVQAKKIKISWDTSDVSCGIIQYAVHYETKKPLTVFRGSNITDLSQGSVEVDVTPSFTYNIYVNGLTATAEPPTPDFVLYTVPSIPPDDFPRIHVSSKTLTSLTVQWDKLSIYHRCGNVTGYDLLYQRPDGKTVPIPVPGGEGTTQFTITGLDPGTIYNIVIRAKNEAGDGKWSQPFLADSTVYLTTKGSPPTVSTTLPSTSSTTTTTPKPTTTSTTTTTTTPQTTTTTTTAKPTTSTTTTSTTQTTTTTTKPTTTTVRTPPTTPSNHTAQAQDTDDMNVPFLLAIIGGCILLLAILIPVTFFICRHCCNKTPVGVVDDKPDSPKTKPKRHPPQYPPAVGLGIAHLVAVVNIKPKPPPMQRVPKPNVQYSEFSYEGGYKGLHPHHSGQEYPNLLRKIPRESPVEKPDTETSSQTDISKNGGASDTQYNNFNNHHVSHTNNVYIHNFMKSGRLFTPSTPVTPSIIYRKPKEYYDTLPVPVNENLAEDIPLSQYSPLEKPKRFKTRAILNEGPETNYTL